ncbi:hypothetical protein SAMN04488543_4307 [Friedmanniella luteola]|uniref:Glycosyltransferase n=1 Tax=Friedmanniella luteola TaxID=546871 RepID=A0A1H2A982_9ACTN|nr:glycosyltransferase [Friedmanniella luteola]SDT42437.1 hypothetical protein SAMN04488543_4307 [Friedmanniella luteola]
MTAVPVLGPAVSFDHLLRLTDDGGLFEHAELTTPRPEHGYCVDDLARGLVVLAREPSPAAPLRRLGGDYLRLVVDAQAHDGRFHNRRSLEGRWTDAPTLDDCWGRALWGLGSVAARWGDEAQAGVALRHFERGARHRSPHLRADVFAALGAAEVLTVRPGHRAARRLLTATADRLLARPTEPGWPWPEPRLRYANGSLPEVLVAAGHLLGDARLLEAGLRMLTWLLDVETSGDQLSLTPVGGWARGEPRPGYDQQPIEVAALADACARALDVTGDPRWAVGLERCRRWFHGANDTGVMLLDVISGGGYDGLERHGRNENQGAESTLALISTLQRSAAVTAART